MLTTRKLTSEEPDPNGKRRELPDGKCGLYFVVQASGATSWVCRYRFDGKPTRLTLGKFPALTLARARERARNTEGPSAAITLARPTPKAS